MIQKGKTTRLIDYYIQKLFILNQVEILDHTGNNEDNKILAFKILARLRCEHLHCFDYIEFNRETNILKFNNEYLRLEKEK